MIIILIITENETFIVFVVLKLCVLFILNKIAKRMPSGF